MKLLGNRFDTFVCDLPGDLTRQDAQLGNFLSLRKPRLLNITGPRESLGQSGTYSVYERCSDVLSRTLPGHTAEEPTLWARARRHHCHRLVDGLLPLPIGALCAP
jgi:hypothetical protein